MPNELWLFPPSEAKLFWDEVWERYLDSLIAQGYETEESIREAGVHRNCV